MNARISIHKNLVFMNKKDGYILFFVKKNWSKIFQNLCLQRNIYALHLNYSTLGRWKTYVLVETIFWSECFRSKFSKINLEIINLLKGIQLNSLFIFLFYI